MTRRLLTVLLLVVLAGGACTADEGGDGDDTADAAETSLTPEDTVTPATTAPAEEDTELPMSDAVATLDEAYTFTGGVPDPADLPAEPGAIEVQWYRAGEVMAVVYAGLDPGIAACPGNSALVGTDFGFVSNAELPTADCAGFPTLIESDDDQGVQLCGDRVAYLTLIPSDTAATLVASVEAPLPGGDGVGLTGGVLDVDPADLPEVDAASLRC